MAVPKITLYVDIVSPFAYIAFHVLKKSPTFAKCNVTYVPIFLGGLMHACNNTAPINIKNKAQWTNTERLRWAKYFSVSIAEQMPDGFPIKTLAVQRALCSVAQKAPTKLASVIEALYHSLWVERNSKIGEPEGFAPILEAILGKQSTQEILSDTTQADIKAFLNANTDQAFKVGAFGLPWFECTDTNGNTEGFWGVDHFGQVADFLGLDRSRDSGFKALL
ncbi:2-hydroxychromene-2-carboxylate isomerase [Penicillium pulvis]|uniref:2-hydroxychromene-2-carboxylate isomerase n=1 Tax=Penicillium pulvis TaxID=1562058 RepID=UPI002547808A|nr:2-hydroxychromene-2-carboxylate isomerase [Penicillium pulvis]KAJ5810297.1 2-hydroxychromene-2-carboxylate isomerase [Penicillium pulvis]